MSIDRPNDPRLIAQLGESSESESVRIHPRLEFVASLMDDCITIPGTTFKIGLDGLIGLIPVVGDVATLLVARFFFQEAKRLGVSRWTKTKMYGNYLIDFLVGSIPIVGDAFDFGFKAHRRNLKLLQAHVAKKSFTQTASPPRRSQEEATAADFVCDSM